MKIPKLKRFQIIEIEWQDSCHASGWMAADKILYRDVDYEHRTVGYFLKETRHGIAVVQSRRDELTANVMVDAHMEIPKAAITRIRKL